MKVLFSTLFSLLACVTFAQTNLNVFSDKGERFWVTINGIKQNAKASQHVKITNLTGNFWKMRIVFENQNLPEVSQNVGAMEQNQEYTYQVKQNRKGEYVIRPFSVAPINEKSNAETTIVYHPTELPVEVKEKKDETGFSLKVNENGFDLKVNVPDKPNNTTNTQENWNNNPNNNNTGNCWQAMNSADFEKALGMVEKQSFESNKMEVAQQFTRKNCLSIEQVIRVAEAFSFEDNKYDYATFAYDYCQDKRNYYQLSDVFTFSATKEKFNDFLQGK